MEDIIIAGSSGKKMSSQEIAELVEKRHDNVKRTIETIVNNGIVELPQIESVKNHLGQAVKMYLLDKRSSLIVVAQLSPEFTARVVDRWQELEAQAGQCDPIAILNDPTAMRGLLLTYTEKVLALEEKVSAQAPKVAALDRIANADGYTCITDAAKVLQVRPKDLFSWLAVNCWIYRRVGGSGWVAYQQRIQQGLLHHKVTIVQRNDGTEKVCEQVLLTAKGLSKLAEHFFCARA